MTRTIENIVEILNEAERKILMVRKIIEFAILNFENLTLDLCSGEKPSSTNF